MLVAAPCVAQTAPAKPAAAVATPATTPTTPMTFQAMSTLLPGPGKGENRRFFAILAAGEIGPGTVDRFRALVRGKGITDARILFDSLGGSAAEALALGKAIRELGFDTQVGASGNEHEPGTCAAECVYAFAGGTARFFHAGVQRLGIMGAGKMATDGPAAATLMAFLAGEGVDVDAYAKAVAAGGQGMKWLDRDSAELIGIVNNGSAPPTTRIEMENGRPMLVIRQQNSDSTAIADFTCGSEGGIYATLVAISTPGTAKYVTGFTASDVQFDRDDRALGETGEKAGQTKGYGAALVRFLSPAAATRILTAREMIIWLRHPDYEWGAAVTLRFVRPQIAAYFKTCAPAPAQPVESSPLVPDSVAGGGKDLVLAGSNWKAGHRSMVLLDRASIVRTGNSVSLVSYAGSRIDGVEFFSMEAVNYDCVTNIGRGSVVEVDGSGKPISRGKDEWKPGDNAISLIGKPACDASLIDPRMVIGDGDPIALLRRFVESTAGDQP